MTQRKIALSIEEAADYTGIGRNTLRQLVEWKKLPVLKVGRKVLIKTDILEMFMEANEGRDLRDRGKCKSCNKKLWQIKKAASKRNRQRFYQTKAMIYLHARRLYDVLLLIRNRELMFAQKRKENVIMAKSTKSYEERMLEMEKKEQESLEKAKRYAAQKKELLKRKKAEESKKRTHRLCQIGGAVESVLGAPIEEEDIPKLIGFLKRQEANGKFFSKAMQKEVNTDMEEV